MRIYTVKFGFYFCILSYYQSMRTGIAAACCMVQIFILTIKACLANIFELFIVLSGHSNIYIQIPRNKTLMSDSA